jgi:hypothetical protein
MQFVKVKYRRQGGVYFGGEYTYQTELPLAVDDKVITPTVNEPRQRGIVTQIGVASPKFQCREITEYDPDAELVTV